MMFRDTQGKPLGPVDSAFYYVDRPETPMNIGALTILEGRIDFDAFVKLVDSRIHQAPLYLKRVVETRFNLGQPMWMYDPEFYIGNHVFKTTVPAPGNLEQLRKLAGNLVSGMLDRSKPLWEIHLIDGLEAEQTGIFFKIHHCMVDGMAAIELFTLLFDLSEDGTTPARKPLYDPPYLPGDAGLIGEALKQELGNKVKLLGKLTGELAFLGSVLGDREKRRKALTGAANLINDNLSPLQKLIINGRNSGKQALAWAEFPLSEVRAIKAKVNASVNDVMLAVLADALGQYQQRYEPHTRPSFVRMLVPVNMREKQEAHDFGNRISVLPIDIPLYSADPLKRLDAVARYSTIMKESSLSNGLDILLTLPALAPGVAQPLVWSFAPKAFSLLAHLWCTNVAGPPLPVFVLGHRMLHTFGFFPLNPSMGLACVVASYNQRITMTLVADRAIVPDVEEISALLESAYRSLRRAAGVEPVEETVRRPNPAPKPVDPPAPKPVDPPAHVEAVLPVVAVVVEAPASYQNGHHASAEAAAEVVIEVIEATVEAEPAPDTAGEVQPVAEPIAAVEPEPAVIPVSVNGHASAVLEVPTVSAPAETPRPSKNGSSIKLFSEEWAQAYREAINASDAYRRASTNWTAGPLALVIEAAPNQGFSRSTAVFLDLHRGTCRAARTMSPQQAYNDASYVIEGNYGTWLRVLRGEAQPLQMIMMGRLRLKKGSLSKLMPFTQSAQELIRSAQDIPSK